MSDFAMGRPTGGDPTPADDNRNPLQRLLDAQTKGVIIVGWILGIWFMLAQGGWWPGIGAALVFAILTPIGALIGNAARLWVMPEMVFSGEGFFGLLKARIFWNIGPQCIGVLIVGFVVHDWLL